MYLGMGWIVGLAYVPCPCHQRGITQWLYTYVCYVRAIILAQLHVGPKDFVVLLCKLSEMYEVRSITCPYQMPAYVKRKVDSCIKLRGGSGSYFQVLYPSGWSVAPVLEDPRSYLAVPGYNILSFPSARTVPSTANLKLAL